MCFEVVSFVILISCATIAAQFYGSLSGYACGQQQLYDQCQCQSFCSPYQNQYSSYSSEGGYHWRRPHHRPRHHKKKKFHFESLEEIDSSEFPEVPSTTKSPKATTYSWEDEDLWEKKFVNEKASRKSSTLDSEEFPEIDSREVESAKIKERDRATQSEREELQSRSQSGGSGRGVGIGSGIGVGGIGVNSGLGIGAPGIGGLGGRGGIFGISSGVGVGVPGIGPIGVSSGLGIGK